MNAIQFSIIVGLLPKLTREDLVALKKRVEAEIEKRPAERPRAGQGSGDTSTAAAAD